MGSVVRMKIAAIALLALALFAAGCSDDDIEPSVSGEPLSAEDAAPTPTTEGGQSSGDLTVLTRGPYATGGDVLVEYTGSAETVGFTAGGVELEVEQRDDTVYLVSGLPDGESTIEAPDASVDVVNYPITGPVFSGPHQEPLFCTLGAFGLEPTGDDDCSAKTRIEYGTIDESGEFAVLPDGAAPDDPGEVIRLETGTINRGVYQVAVLDPSMGAEPIEPGKHLIYRFGGGCGTGHTQGRPLGAEVLDVEALAADYIVATSTFNTFQTHCNDVLSAETFMMTQEHIDEMLGPIGLTVGSGGSGGAIQQYSIMQNYPGLLDAAQISVSFPDAITIAAGVTDCGLLLDYFGSEEGSEFSDAARRAIQGHGTTQTCQAWRTTFLDNIDPSKSCDGAIPAEEVYDPADNPDGIRCTLQDSASNLFGVDADGFGIRALDNTGVQYGLGALNDGVITVDQFLDLNGAIGGYDIDGTIGPDRMNTPAEVFEAAYADGRVFQAGGDSRTIPIIDTDLYSDLAFDIHDRHRLFAVRERLTGDAATASPNRVIWTRGGAGLIEAVSGGDPESARDSIEAVAPSQIDGVDLLVEWATTGQRPDGVADDCIIDGERIVGDEAFAPGQPCAETYPYFGDPRTAAGAPLRNDIIKCTTVPVDVDAYEVEFDTNQAAALEQIFPDGVCDWSLPGVGQVPLRGTWLEYGG